MKEIEETYFSVDIESDGPIPGPHSMLSFGVAAMTPKGKILGTFERNLETLPGASGDPDTMAWWLTQEKAWKACRENLVEPAKAMQEFSDWVRSIPGSPVMVGYPALFDGMFLYWYLVRFVGAKASPFSFGHVLDIKSYGMAVMRKPFRQSTKRNMPKSWFYDLPDHTHVALDDATEQGMLFSNILKANHHQ